MTSPLIVPTVRPPSVAMLVSVTSPEIERAIDTCRAPLIVMSPLVVRADESPVMSRAVRVPEMVLAVTRVPAGAVTT